MSRFEIGPTKMCGQMPVPIRIRSQTCSTPLIAQATRWLAYGSQTEQLEKSVSGSSYVHPDYRVAGDLDPGPASVQR